MKIIKGFERIFLVATFGLLSEFANAQMSCPVTQGSDCTPYVVPMYAGQTLDVGTVSVSNDDANLYVTYKIDTVRFPTAALDGALHLWIGTDMALAPFNPASGGRNPKPSNPIPGQFPYHSPDLSGQSQTTYTFTIPLTSLALVTPAGGSIRDLAGTTLYVLAHGGVRGHQADLSRADTTWGGCTGFNLDGGGRWYYSITYQLRFCEAPPPPPLVCETAFGRLALNSARSNVWVWTTDPKSNPEKLKSLSLTKNRWGWANRLDGSAYSGQGVLYAGAGLNDLSKGKAVGTITANFNAGKASVAYVMNAGNTLEEVHVYASGAQPRILAPGQYGYIARPEVSAAHTAEIDVTPGLDGSVWIIAHGVVCYPELMP